MCENKQQRSVSLFISVVCDNNICSVGAAHVRIIWQEDRRHRMLCYTLFFLFMRKISGTVIGLLEVGDIKVFINIWKYLLHLFVEI